jgi:hypothetical protein
MKMEEIVNPYVASFLERNSFKNVGGNQFANQLCMVTVLPEIYKINFTNYDGDFEMYTDSWSIPHLVGTLTWHGLLDRNYAK